MIRAMTTCEIRAGLRQAAVVVMETGNTDWWGIDVCRADAVFRAADALADPVEPSGPFPEAVATFLLLCAEAQ